MIARDNRLVEMSTSSTWDAVLFGADLTSNDLREIGTGVRRVYRRAIALIADGGDAIQDERSN